MDDERLYEQMLVLQGQLGGIQQVLAMLINGLPPDLTADLPARLADIEAEMRRRGAHDATIQMVRSYREMLSGPKAPR